MLLGVGVLAGDDIDDQRAGQVQDRQGLPGQGRGECGADRRRAMFGPGQVAAVEDLGAVADDRLGGRRLEPVDQRPEPAGAVGDEAAADPRFDPLELLVDGGQADSDLAERVKVGGADRGMDASDDRAHQLDYGREEDLPSVPWGGGPLEEAIDLRGIDGAFQQGTEHDGNGDILEEAFEGLTEEQGRGPCVKW